MDKEKLTKILELHRKYINGEDGGVKADLSFADLHSANLHNVDLDYSCWGFSCKTLSVKIDKRIAIQLLYHTIAAMKSVDDGECKEFCKKRDGVEAGKPVSPS